MGIRELAWLFFGVSGRISRFPFLLGGLLLALAQGFCLYRFGQEPRNGGAASAWALMFMAATLVSQWSMVALGVKRLHDLNLAGRAAIVFVLPAMTIVVFLLLELDGIFGVGLFLSAVSLLAFLILCYFHGTRGANRYGATTNTP